MSKRVILIYDKYENDYGFVEESSDKTDSMEIVIPELSVDSNRKLKIYTWGEKKNMKEPECQVTFDVTKFFSKASKQEIRKADGRDDFIQLAIMKHPKFEILMEQICDEIENNDLNCISFVCNHGKHRSVGFAEIIHKYYYSKAQLVHLCLDKKKKKN